MTEPSVTEFKFETAPEDEIPDSPKPTLGTTIREKTRRRDSKLLSDEPKKSPATPPASQAKKLCEPIPDIYRFIGMSVAAIDLYCGMAIVDNADMLGESWLKLAETNPAFRRFLMKLTQAGGVGTVIAAHLPIAAVIFAHHTPQRRVKTDETSGDTE